MFLLRKCFFLSQQYFSPQFGSCLGEIGMLLRTVRTSMLDALSQDYMDMAKVKGLPKK
jgi:ABC-type dipeptide/oligopeptide/nickel transport system permease component